MSFVYRVLCFFGSHDWFISEKKLRYDLDPNTNGWIALMITAAVVNGIILFASAVTYLSPEPNGIVNTVMEVPLVSLGIELTLGLLWVFLKRNEYRMDARCLRCGKQKLELSHRNNAVHEARRFFASYKSIDKDASNRTDSSTGQ